MRSRRPEPFHGPRRSLPEGSRWDGGTSHAPIVEPDISLDRGVTSGIEYFSSDNLRDFVHECSSKKSSSRKRLSATVFRVSSNNRPKIFYSSQILPDCREAVASTGVDQMPDRCNQLVEATLGFLFHA